MSLDADPDDTQPLSDASPAHDLSHPPPEPSDVSGVDEFQQDPRSPPSPHLGPSLPPSHSSAISPLVASISGDDDGHLPDAQDIHAFEAQTLMQMLSLVGSRLMEADQLGIIDANDSEGGSTSAGEDREEVGEFSDEVQRPPSDPQYRDRNLLDEPVPVPRFSQRRHGIMSALFDADATPKGGRTPLESSLHSAQRSSRQSSLKTKLSQTPIRQSPPVAAITSEKSDESSSEEDEAEEEQPGGVDHQMMEASLHSLSESAYQPPASNSPSSSQPEERRKVLTSKLRTIFALPSTDEVHSCYPCWLYRSVLLQGHLYLTTGHALFYAYLPSREDHVIKAGPIRKRTQKTFRFSRHWAVLRGRALSWYDSARDPYFPQDHIDLRNVLAVRASSKKARHFRIHTPKRIFVFEVDSEDSRDDWVHTLQKTVFRAQNEGDSVRLSIPLETIVDVENTISRGADEADMVCLQVVDSASASFALDEYYFLRFQRQADFVQSLRQLVVQHAESATERIGAPSLFVRDSTSSVQRSVAEPVTFLKEEEIPSLPSINPRKEVGSTSHPMPDLLMADAVKITTEPLKEAIAIPSSSTPRTTDPDDFSLSATPRAPQNVLSGTFKESDSGQWGYPPSPASRGPPPGFESAQREAALAWPVPKWVKDAPGRLIRTGGTRSRLTSLLNTTRGPLRPISEIWSSRPLPPPSSFQGDDIVLGSQENLSISQSSSFSMLEAPDGAETEDHRREVKMIQFRNAFSLPREDELIYDTEACLYRVLPVSGRVFVSSKHVCFRSSSLATKTLGRTKMILPFQEVVSCATHPAFRYGWHGLVAMVRGHEEIFFEFPSKKERDDCLSSIEAQIEPSTKSKLLHTSLDTASQQERQDALILTDLSANANELSLGESTSSLASTSSGSEFQQDGSLLSFKPKQSMHFTILTIGSRGDVQPFLALSKGLIAEGHRVKMATHAEFGPWIQQHGVDFVEIGGDPAELMKICVENGTFTVSFLREGVTKFRGWLDELLVSCWHACQGTDVVIESPNAIAGIHIAEALQIPYFRAFTMPWSRTRAYPQAFAVPNKKAGGNYNYMTYVIFDQVLWTASAGQINRWRSSCLGLRPTTLDKLEQHKTPFLYNFSPNLVPKPLDWYDWIHVTGFWFLDNPESSTSKAWTPPADLLAFIARARKLGRKLVYIGWGSITVPDAAATTRCVTEAVKKSNVCAILSKGWSDRLQKKSEAGADLGGENSALASEDIFQVNSVPHDWLFPQMDAACHHGGAGTLGASLRAGIPTIVKPFFGDQFFWGQQVESLGVGSCVRNLTVDSLCHALVQATQSTRQIERAKTLGRQIRSESGVAEAIRAIYADLDYARSLIKKDTRSTPYPAIAKRSASRTSTTTSSPSQFSSPFASRSLSPAMAARTSSKERARGASSDPVGGTRSRANSGQRTSDEWSVVSGSEEDEERRITLTEQG